MSIPTEAERLASYRASMAATAAAHPSARVVAGVLVPGSGCLQTSDTARHIHQMAQRKEQQANTLTPAEIINADFAARQAARAKAAEAGKTLSDTDIQRAGREGVAAAAKAAT